MTRSFLIGLGILAGLASPVLAQSGEMTLPGFILDVEKLYQAGDFYYTHVPEAFSSDKECLARGFSAEVCDEARTMCAIQDLAGTQFDLDNIMNVFKVDCGNGICFACCFTGFGCHTSFYDPYYRPVINCSPGPGYGPIAFQAGPTLIVDPNAKPGDPCLFVKQSCDHLPLCLSGKPPQEIARINNDPTHVLKSPQAVNSRARTFATSMLGNWSDYLSGFHTSTAQQTDLIHAQVRDFADIGGFLTGRGCVGWRSRPGVSTPIDWSDPHFRINDSAGDFADEPSRYNGVRELGLARLLVSIPNVFNRLAFVESRIWTKDAIAQYLAAIGDPDAALRRIMSPIALEVLKRNRQLQDYRLLAVSLPGEAISPRFYGGCTLGDPPPLQVTVQQRGTFGIDVRAVAAPEVDVLVLWGDGSTTRVRAAGSGVANASHDYVMGGKYQLIAIAQGDSGLRTFAAALAETAGKGVSSGAAPLPVISEVQLVDVRATIDSFAGNTMSMLFDVEGWTPSTGYALGVSHGLPVPQDAGAVTFGTIGGWNPSAAPLHSITIRPWRFGPGVLIGFHRNYFTFARLRVGIFSTARGQLRYYDIPITADLVRLYATGSSTPVPLTAPTYAADGRLEIPVQTPTVRYSRIDLVLPDSFFLTALDKPVTDPTWKGLVGNWSELRPEDGGEFIGKRRATGR